MRPATRGSKVAGEQVSAWNIANILTIVRIILVPLFAWLLLQGGGENAAMRWWATACFLLAIVTDRIDGDLARSRGLVTDFGKVADPIADKALIGTAFVGLSLIGVLPWWVTVVVLAREGGITALRFVVIRHGVMPASRGGKLKTVLQSVSLTIFLMPLFVFPLQAWWQAVAWAVMLAALTVTVATGVDYVAKAVALRRTAMAGGPAHGGPGRSDR